MDNEEKYNQIINEAYENYKQYFENKYGNYITGTVFKEDGEYLIVNKNPLPKETILNIIYSKEEFINKIKTDDEFAKTWGLKIEERELSLEERLWLFIFINNGSHPEDIEVMDDYDTPTKLITITYNDIKTEIYE